MEYEVLPHTADLRIRAWGKTLPELFRNALLGLSSVMAGSAERESPVQPQAVVVSAPSPTNLLIDFLNEVLYLSNVQKAIYDRVEFSQCSEQELAATLGGFRLDGFARDVKAVTYHGAEIKKNREGCYEVEILLDI